MAAGRRAVPLAEINVTPLVDVLLVLLIIFMVVVPSASRGLDAAIPPKPSASTPPPPDPLIVMVDRTGLSLNRQPVPKLSDLADRLADAFIGRTDRTVFVRADGALSYGSVVEVIDAAVGAGADRIGLMDSPRYYSAGAP